MKSIRVIRADLHNHFTHRSKVLDPNRVADTVYHALGKGGICALVNYSDRRFEAFADRAEKSNPRTTRLGNAVYFPDRDVLIVKGEEVPTQEGDTLVIGTLEDVHLAQRKPLEYTLKEAIDNGGINVIVDPFLKMPLHTSRVGETIQRNPNLANYVTAIQVFSGIAPREANKKAERLFHTLTLLDPEKLLGALSCSDGHSFREVGNCWTQIPMDEPYNLMGNPEDVTRAISKAITTPLMVPTGYNLRQSYGITDISTEKERRREKTSLSGRLEHTAVIGGIILASGIKIPISRGDKEALRAGQ